MLSKPLYKQTLILMHEILKFSPEVPQQLKLTLFKELR